LRKSFLQIGENEKFLFVHPKYPNKKFKKSIESIQNYKAINPNQVNVKELLNHDKLVFTKKSLKEFTELFLAYLFYLNKPKAVVNERVNKILCFNTQ